MKIRTLLVTLALLVVSATPALAEGVEMMVAPKTIQIDTFYNGTSIRAAGTVPAGCDVLIRTVGSPANLHMKQKGRVLGMWMNLDSLTFEDVPSIFLVNASGEFAKMEPAAGDLRTDGLAKLVRVDPEGVDAGQSFKELLKLKRKEGLYRESPAGVSFGPEADGLRPFEAEIPMPSRLSPGTYKIEAYAIRDGQIVGSESQEVQAVLVSTPAFLSDMAFGHGALYGVLATVVALLSGLAIGLVFQSKGAH